MTITDELIQKAEQLLLPQNCTFDDERDERKDFIKNLSSLDLIAVPGSGKTTALQAKLCCLEHFMPMEQGVLVLAHTNVAVEEIKKNLLHSCPKLFEYPNFIGTIQDFVDTYLAIPYYQNKYGQSIVRIDDEIYRQLFFEYVKLPRNYKKPSMNWYLRFCDGIFKKLGFEEILNVDMHFLNIRLDVNDYGEDILKTTKGELFYFVPPDRWVKENTVKDNQEFIINNLIKLKKSFALAGYLCYDDCYYFAKKFLYEMPNLKHIFRHQFKYIFVDETQDLEEKQLKLIDDIFLCEECVLQRIGDINQSILHDSWRKPRNMSLIQKSFRLTSINGKIVNAFTLESFENKLNVQGVKSIGQDIKPHLILFDFYKKDRIVSFFRKLITDYELYKTDEGIKYGFHIVGWAASAKRKVGKYALEDYFSEYCKQNNNLSTQHYATLNEMIQLGRKSNTSKYCKNTIYRIICEFARLVSYKFNNKHLSVKNINKWISSLQDNDKTYFDIFIFNAIQKLITQAYETAYNYIKRELSERIINIFDANLNKNTQLFLQDGYSQILATETDTASNSDNIKIEIESIHSVKGMTHCATLYIETYYHKKYESTHLVIIKHKGTKKRPAEYYPNPLLLQDLDSNSLNSYAKQAIKMMYVGFSRPTHLLCFAMLKSNFDANSSVYTKEAFENAGWIVDDLTEDSQ